MPDDRRDTPAGWALDLDGVVWLAGRPLPGAVEAVRDLQDAGHRVVFVTNNAQRTREDVSDRLESIGIDVGADNVVTSAMAVGSLVRPGDRVLLCAGPGVAAAVEAAGATIVAEGRADVVAVGRHEDLSLEGLNRAVLAVRGGARLIAANSDPTYPTGRGLELGAGAVLAAIEVSSGRPADVVAGKPNAAIAELVAARLGERGIVVGDVPATDGSLAVRLGYRFVLVMSGVTSETDLPCMPRPHLVAPDLRAAVDAALSGGGFP